MADAYPTALTIAGSDSGGGAGIQADLKTFIDHRVFGMSVVTAVTAQNTQGVFRIDALPPEAVTAQLEAIFSDLTVGSIKIGMLANAGIVHAVADGLSAVKIPVVLDPVMVSSTGQRLLEPDAEAALRERLLPLATVITPNRAELAVLSDATDLDEQLAWANAQNIAVLATGGDPTVGEDDDIVTDVLVRPDWPLRRWSSPRLGKRSFHGTGCTLSAAIAARLSHGRELDDAVDGAILYVQALIRASESLGSPGKGHAVLPHGLD